MDHSDQPEPSLPKEVRARVSAPTYELMQKMMATLGIETIDDLILAGMASLADRNKTGYYVEVPALILELQALRQNVETLTIGNLQLAELYQLAEANQLDSIAAVLTTLSRVDRGAATTPKRS